MTDKTIFGDMTEEEIDELVAEMQPEAEAPAPSLGDILGS